MSEDNTYASLAQSLATAQTFLAAGDSQSSSSVSIPRDDPMARGLSSVGSGQTSTGMDTAVPSPCPAPTVEAKKNDEGKPDLSLIPEAALVEAARAFMVGAKKYGRYNYLRGTFTICRIMAAMLRHAYAYLRGEEYDPVDGQHHIGSIIACAGIILDLRARGKLIDDRYKEPAP